MPYDTCGGCKSSYHYKGKRKPDGRLVLCALIKEKIGADCIYPNIPDTNQYGELANSERTVGDERQRNA